MYLHTQYPCSDDASELYPVLKIEQEVRGEKDIYGPGSLQDTYYQVCGDGNIMFQALL